MFDSPSVRTLLVFGLLSASALAEPQAELVSVQKIWDKAPHNGFTDLIRFKGKFFCCLREGEDHVGGDGVIRIIGSTDGQGWTDCVGLTEKGWDLREPKLEVSPDGQKLCMLCDAGIWGDKNAMKARHTCLATSPDGKSWSPVKRILGEGDCLWRIAVNPADKKMYGMANNIFETTNGGTNPEADWPLRIYSSTDGAEWLPVATLNIPGQPTQPTLRFLRDGRAMFLVRRYRADRMGVIGVASAPYRDWQWMPMGERIAGPDFIELPDGMLIAGARRYGKTSADNRMVLSKMTTAGFEPLLELPSSGGDCGYPGLLWHEGLLWVSYNSSHEGKTSVYLARVRIAGK